MEPSPGDRSHAALSLGLTGDRDRHGHWVQGWRPRLGSEAQEIVGGALGRAVLWE